MNRPWTAERSVSVDLARCLIEDQFPHLAPVRAESLGVGWDNSAFLVNGEWIFRFPRRRIAVGLLEVEHRLLPAIAPRLPLPIPVPKMLGHGSGGYPWPFSGYRALAGHTACVANLDDAHRRQAAAPVAEFLAALHAVAPDHARRNGASPDALGRLDVDYRVTQIAQRLEQLSRIGVLRDVAPWQAMNEAAPGGRPVGSSALVHGDLDARHLLVADDGRPAGVIDWGDVHLGDPAIDLAFAHGFLPPDAHDTFCRSYGSIDDTAWAMARFKALHTAVMVLHYGHDIGNVDLVREARTSLEYLSGY